MCNLYSMTKGQQAILELSRAMRDMTGNLPQLPGIFPDYSALIVRTGSDGVRELAMARWGMPSPAFALEGKKVDRGVTNIRNTGSPHWWLGGRCDRQKASLITRHRRGWRWMLPSQRLMNGVRRGGTTDRPITIGAL